LRRRTWFALGLLSSVATRPALAQPQPEPVEGTGEMELAKKLQNPVSDLISVPFQNNTDFDVGPSDRTRNTLNFQPVIPVGLGEHVNLINRFILPLVSQPDPHANTHSFGLGDLSATFLFSPARPGRLIWGIGPSFLLPTSTGDIVGTEKWSVGPAAVALVQPHPWTIGVIAWNVWSFAGRDDHPEVNLLTLQYFVNYNFSEGVYLTSAPILTSNWKAASGEKWTVPFGGGVGKIFRLATLPLNGQVSAYYNVVRPDDGAKWQLRLQLAMLLPK
jgi:hypothetical protein